ncbi:CDP-glycerol glycerophosphotransferase family protein [Stutzerimonas nitrititolerans]
MRLYQECVTDEDIGAIVDGAFFDPHYYVGCNPELAVDAEFALQDYLERGWKEFRDPYEGFDSLAYTLLHGENDCFANPLLHYLRVGRFSNLLTSFRERPRLTVVRRAKSFQKGRALITLVDGPALLKKMAFRFAGLGFSDLAEEAMLKATLRCPSDVDLLLDLGKMQAANDHIDAALETFTQVIQLKGGAERGFFELAEAYFTQAAWQNAIAAYLQALEVGDSFFSWTAYYRLGLCFERCGCPHKADFYYKLSIDLCQDEAAICFGIGILHLQQENWIEAEEAFRTNARMDGSAEIYFFQGLAQGHCRRWESAIRSLRMALELSPDRAEWYFLLGVASEHSGQFTLAASAYREAIERSPMTSHPQWQYRLALSLDSAGRWEAACDEWQKAFDSIEALDVALEDGLSNTETSGRVLPIFYYQSALRLELEGKLNEAQVQYAEAIAREPSFQPAWLHRHASCLVSLGRFREASHVYAHSVLFSLPPLWGKLSGAEKVTSENLYRAFLENIPIRKEVILYESFGGKGMCCSPLAIFERLLNSVEGEGYLHVWSVNDLDAVDKRIYKKSNVIVIQRNSHSYQYYLAIAGRLVNNATFPPYFLRRSDQFYLNTWHGTPLKSLGRHVQGSVLAYKNTARNFLQASCLLSPSEYATMALVDCYDLSATMGGRIYNTGYPRIDKVVATSEEQRESLRALLGLRSDKPILLYAPTYRGVAGSVDADLRDVLAVLRVLETFDIQIVFRGHYFIERQVLSHSFSVSVATMDVDACQLLSITDVLVTDYSSIFFDFLPVQRPIIHYVPDLEEYESVQGKLLMDLHDLPGRKCFNLEELAGAVNGTLDREWAEHISDYQSARNQYCSFEDGDASSRAAKLLMNGSHEEYVASNEHSRCLVHIDDMLVSEENIRLAVAEHLDVPDPCIVLAVDPWKIDGHPEQVAGYRRLAKIFPVIARVGYMLLSAEEAELVNWVRRVGVEATEEIENVISLAYKRDYRRLFGEVVYDAHVSLGKDPYWHFLFKFAPRE